RTDVSATIEQGVDRMAGTRQDDVRQALAQVEERAGALREETARLQDFGQDLAEQLRAEVARTIQDGMTTLMAAAARADAPAASEAPSAPAPESLAAELREETERLQRFGDTLAESVRDAVSSALQEAQLANPPAPMAAEAGATPETLVAAAVTAPTEAPPEGAPTPEPPARAPGRRPPPAT